MDDLRIGLKRDAGSLIGRSARSGRSSALRSSRRLRPRADRTSAGTPPTSVRAGNGAALAEDAPRGHQNSSASELVTGPRRSPSRPAGLRVTHSFWRGSSPSSRSSARDLRARRARACRRPVLRAVVSGGGEVGAPFRWKASPHLDHVHLVAGEQRHDELRRGAPVWWRPERPRSSAASRCSTHRRAALLERRRRSQQAQPPLPRTCTSSRT